MRNRRFVLNLNQFKINNPYPSSQESATGSKCVGSCARQAKRNRNGYFADAPLTASRLLLMATGRWATCKKPTAHSGTFGFADTQSQRKKPKEPEFLPTLDRKLIN